MNIINQYLKEIKYLKYYLISIAVVTIISYSVFFICDRNSIIALGREDSIYEWLGALLFVAGSVFGIIIFIYSGNFLFILFSVSMFFGAGEEISWGQRIIGFETPQEIEKINVQKEFTLHNLNQFSHFDTEGNGKRGLRRLFGINFLFRVFTIFLGIVVPFFVYHSKAVLKISTRIKLPVTPIVIGIFFFINWMIFRVLHSYILPEDQERTASEIFEHVAAYILFMVSLYSFIERIRVKIGTDIKHALV
jgi:hypothetical protein